MCRQPTSPKYNKTALLFTSFWRLLGWKCTTAASTANEMSGIYQAARPHGLPTTSSSTTTTTTPAADTNQQWQHPRLIEYDDLPEWAKDNKAIQTGYRKIKACDVHVFESLWYLHNETVNVWSHGLPFLFGWILSLRTILVELPALHASTSDILAFLPLILGSTICYGLSATFHLYLCHSPERFSLWSKLDYIGIVVVLWGGFFTMTWFLFYNHLATKTALITINSLCCLSTFFVILQDRFATPQYRAFRVVPFALLLATSAVPTYMAFTRPTSDPAVVEDVLIYYWACCVTLAVGAMIFVLRVPERFVPRVFDIFGHSHQIFHILVVVAVVCYHKAVLVVFRHKGRL